MEFFVSTGISVVVLVVTLWNSWNNAQIKNSLLTLELSIRAYLEDNYVPLSRFNDLKEEIRTRMNLTLSQK